MEQCRSVGVSCSDEESKGETRESERLTCMDSGDSSFGQNDSPTILPITAPETDDSLTSQDMPETLTDTQTLHAEQFHLLDPNGQPVQYDLQSLEESSAQMTGMAQVIISQEPLVDVTSPHDASEEKPTDRGSPPVRADTLEVSANYILRSQASPVIPKKPGTRMLEEPLLAPLQPLSSNTPIWACRLRSCEKIGDSYRGYCVSETELESILTFHKQQTQSVWGTRQSPSPAKPATRLMWKSQYVPYDGIPFVNAGTSHQLLRGSPAAVLYCERIHFILVGSRAVVMECQYGPRRKGFQLKRINEQESRSCHLYKATCPARIYIKKVQKFPEYRVPTDPQIDRKVIRMEQEKAFTMLKKNLVDAGGVLRWKFVERELFKPDEVPERHNLSFFPTVNDIKNHIHEVQKSLRTGEEAYNSETIPATLQWTTDSGNILRETVTVTFAEGNSLGEPVTSKVGTSRTQTSLSPEPFHLVSPLSSFQPKIFSHLQGLKLQPSLSPLDGSQALVSESSHLSSSPSRLVDTAGNTVVNSHSLPHAQSHSLPADPCPTQNNSAAVIGSLPESVQNLVVMDQLVEVEDVEDAGNLEGSVNRILLGDVQTIPIRIIDSHPTLIEENLEDTLSVNQVKQEPKEPTLSIGAKTFLDCKKVSATQKF
ncbi:calcium-responsive transcription factor isoform X3 [Cricetulus griseus]|uniref:Calcium-responsive transcription factor isoform X3 n=1 Tax=Cricetulus griseus TaxID=10029 RepID=A0A9J7FC54_CRIGR|nr:calcium-responsive transcription factor isoform X3 [Cricetulus griseus]XP_035296749.1 calcium-responsive transcription factor isoform X3 [Cricetulus griseus]